MTNYIEDIQPLIEEYRSNGKTNNPELVAKILADYERLLQLFEQKNKMINRIWDEQEKEKFQLAQGTLDPLEQTLYSSLLGIRALDQEAQSEETKDYLATLKGEIERQLYDLKKASINVYPICMQDLGPYRAIKSLYELLKESGKIVLDVEFSGMHKRQSQKMEIQIYRLLQYLIRIVEHVSSVSVIAVHIEEKDNQIILSTNGENLVNELQPSPEYRLFKELVDSLEGIQIEEQGERNITLVFNLDNHL